MTDLSSFLVRDIPSHRQGFEVHLGTHHRRAEIQQHSLFQAGNGLGKDQEILITGLAQGGAIAIGMLVYDIVTDADMYRDWHSEANPGSQYAQVLVRERTLP